MIFNRQQLRQLGQFRQLEVDADAIPGRQAAPLGDFVEMLLLRHRFEQVSPEQVIQEHWAQVVGAAQAHRCDMVRLEGGHTLVLAVTNPTLRQEMRFARAGLLARVQALPGCAQVSRVEFRAG